MNKTLITTVALAVATLSGCASTSSNYEPSAYKANQSRAYNIAEAGGLVTGIKDAPVPRDKLERLTDTKTFGAAYVLSGYTSPQLGMTNWQGGLVNFANWAIVPKQHGARNSLVAWMPAHEADSPAKAQAKFLSHVKVSIESALTDLGADFTLLYDKDGRLTYQFYKNEWGCPTWVNGQSKAADMCSVKVKLVEPRIGVAPDFVSSVQGAAYAFTSGHETAYNFVNVGNGTTSHAPQQAIYAAISKQLPAWTYLYLAPKSVELENGEKVAFPYLLEQGKAELFVYPEA
ncbi:hypothetical protein HZS38_04970 [Xenorhabdus nematophila]|uniref:Lipoprotein n=1 Tax=Xenorhabdus nematophila (strain ATCC 19061 / DSM 3370 / CCUG 14189 / LMG 1036 / NCIMB 9965 / AN6) TaxID=406817 RepID=D3VLV1_XENNA|nr:hypothetical protein [Xenorhabdus nematophila]CEF32289.1 conserved exported hypothetical protein [Xenorhabdus nematophila str. Websteri]KHD28202.1 hypothetical protein LH67_12560 [Xenorhabdus nematophila]MBA0018545.1 hypothetical protein [Xenorhabdus nematophila]CBJ92903.1 hypothetical protein; putative exported protein [Xenorhabdus nematophila ATCC 19061]CEK25514.1 conserved exported protein of unknown function [Xenorhabdus nematophila AN6/1]